MIKKIAREFVFPILLKSGVMKVVEQQSKNNFLILNYHGVVEETNSNLSANHMSVNQFSAHIDYLSKNYRIVPLDQIVHEIIESTKPIKKTIAITFDDGYENNFLLAYPILKKYNLPATIFITTSKTDTDNLLWYDELDFIKEKLKIEEINLSEIKLNNRHFQSTEKINSISELKNLVKSLLPEDKSIILSWLKNKFKIVDPTEGINPLFWKQLNNFQIKEMNDSGLINFGSHTVNHPNLDLIPTTLIKEELTVSKIKIEKITGKIIDTIAFPDGAYNEEVKKLSNEEGYHWLFAVNYRCTNDNAKKGVFKRFSISNTTTFESVMLQISLAFNKSGH